MAAFEDFKKHEDERVNSRCAEMDARLDALSVDFDEELYPHMLTAIAGRRWLIGHGLHLAVMKCAESMELSQAFANVVSAGIAKDFNYPLIDEFEQLKDAPLDVIMASLYLDSDTGEDAPQFIRELYPSSSQLEIPMYPEVRNLRNPWACKDEILLEDAITANISRVKKKKKSRVICHTDGVADAATQTKDEESPRLLRSKSLPAMFNLDWP
ncbi:hypothetical protein Tco_1431321 [Tanacetum coccineum]